jgi:hypothetical protein
MRTIIGKISGLALLAAILIITSCSSPVTLTGWKNPKENVKVSKVVVWAMFNKLEYQKPFEKAAVDYFNSRGLKAIGSLSLIAPGKKYELVELEKVFDSIGADAVLIYNYTGTDKTENYVPQSTTIYPSYYGSYYGYYSWGYNSYYAPGAYNEVTTGGYWTSTTVVNLTANLYNNANNEMIWTGNITVTDPQYVDQSSYNISRYIYSEWVDEKIVNTKK